MKTGLWRYVGVMLMLTLLVGCGETAREGAGNSDGDGTLNTAPRTNAVTVGSILENPAVYYKQPISIPAYVKQVIGPNALVVSDDKNDPDGQEILVINDAQSQTTFDSRAVGEQILVQGTLQPFGELQLKPDQLPAAESGRFADRPVLVATTIANPGLGDSGSQVTVTPLDGKLQNQPVEATPKP